MEQQRPAKRRPTSLVLKLLALNVIGSAAIATTWYPGDASFWPVFWVSFAIFLVLEAAMAAIVRRRAARRR